MDRTKPFNTNCLQCGVSLLGMCQPEKRKYCSSSCRSKYILRQKKPGVQTKLWQHETEVYEGAMEMYWNGMGGAAIARFFNIPDGTVYSWIHDFGGLRPRVDPIKLSSKKMIALKSLKEKFKMATSADEWLEALRDDTDQTKEGFENINIQLVCGFLHGYSATKLATVVSESLKEDPLSGNAYAFCNKGQNTITVLACANWTQKCKSFSSVRLACSCS